MFSIEIIPMCRNRILFEELNRTEFLHEIYNKVLPKRNGNLRFITEENE